MTAHSSALANHLAGTCTTVCHCWKLERRDGLALGFTDHDREIVVDGFPYAPETGLAQSEVRTSLGLAADAVEVEAALSSAAIEDDDVDAGLFDRAKVTTLLVNWREPTEYVVLRRASVGKITRSDGRFVAELESIAASLDRPNGRYLRRQCDAMLGDARCGVDLEASGLRGTGTILASVGSMAFTVAGLDGVEPGWFSHGRLTWSSGGQVGRTASIIDHWRGLEGVILALPPDSAAPAPGDAFEIVSGCDKRFGTCKAKFNNALNFRGFPHLPGNDAAYRYVSEGTEFDGSALVE